MSDISRGDIRVKGFTDVEMDFQLLRQLGSSSYRGASIGECLHISNVMKNNNPEEWVKEFERLAEWQKKDGMQRLVNGAVVSGREQLFKASNSFRAAEYYSPCSSEHHRALGINSAGCFGIAMSNMDLHCETHSIYYNNVNLPAYFITPQNDGAKRKTIMIVSGFDGTLEEEFMLRGLAALERGYNVIHFAGPGQMDVFRKYPDTHFEPHFEKVVSTVIDYFEGRHEVNMNHLTLMGISFGGYFALRAACHEPRIKNLIVNSPILDLYTYLCSFTGMKPDEMPDSENFGVKDLASIPDELMSTQVKAQTEQLIIRFGQKSFKETFEYLKQFHIGTALDYLKTNNLALIGSAEGGEPKRQFAQFRQKTAADFHEFSDFEGASSHCQAGNVSYANAVAYDWLMDVD